jgi:AAA+ ATPase superfamily predicted ATPase
MENPFLLSGYAGKDTFCNREKEVNRLKNNVLNGVDSLLLSIRRMGKSGLIQHFFHTLDADSDIKPIYFDIFFTQNQAQFINLLATGMARAFHEKSKPGKKVWDFLKSFRPTISFDRLSGMPEISITYQSKSDNEVSLRSMLQFLENQESKIVIAIDEFQQIAQYPETNTEALLRTYIQQLHNVRFIFSGSAPHLLAEMFQSPKRPFFSSTNTVALEPIHEDDYGPFIKRHFEKAGKILDNDALNWIFSFSLMHTYYVQWACNQIFASGIKKITLSKTKEVIYQQLALGEFSFSLIRNLLTINQWELLKAIAKEEYVESPNSQSFIKKYKLGTPSHVNRSLEALLSKELILKEHLSQKPKYRVYDVLLGRWLEEIQ